MASKGLPNAEISTTGQSGVSAAHAAEIQLGSAIRVVKNAVVAPGDGNDGATDEDTVVVLADTNASVATITLSIADTVEGRIIVVSDRGGNAATNAITVATEGTANIDGAASVDIAANYGELRVLCDGTNWFSI